MLFAKHLLEQQIGTLAFGPWHASRYATVCIYSPLDIERLQRCLSRSSVLMYLIYTPLLRLSGALYSFYIKLAIFRSCQYSNGYKLQRASESILYYFPKTTLSKMDPRLRGDDRKILSLQPF